MSVTTRMVSHRGRVQAAVRAGANAGAKAVALKLQAEARRRAPHDDGPLRASIAFAVHEGVAVVGTNLDYAVFQHEGTGKYHPRGRRGGWVYYDYKRREFVFTYGNRPTKFLESAALEGAPEYRRILRQAVEDAVAAEGRAR